MAFRDYEWWMKRYGEKKAHIATIQQKIQYYIDCAEYASAARSAGLLQTELESLNVIANTAAEKMP